MDRSRVYDVMRLKQVIDDPKESARHKRQAHGSLRKIYTTKDDSFIQKNRNRLILAQIANDVDEVEKLSNLLHDYSLRTYGFV